MRPVELEGTPDLVDLVSSAADAGYEAALIERPMPEAVSVAGIGRRYDLVSTRAGVALEDERGRLLAAADLHADDALVPAFDDRSPSEREHERFVPFPRRVEHFAAVE